MAGWQVERPRPTYGGLGLFPAKPSWLPGLPWRQPSLPGLTLPLPSALLETRSVQVEVPSPTLGSPPPSTTPYFLQETLEPPGRWTLES